jgi:uncharacterized UBP type Zn finger protein
MDATEPEPTAPPEPVRLDVDPGTCPHAAGLGAVVPSAAGCEACLAIGSRWVHLRVCMTCGRVACCDDSPNRHARAHHAETGHPVIRSLEPGESWGWCYPDQLLLRPLRTAPAPGGGG